MTNTVTTTTPTRLLVLEDDPGLQSFLHTLLQSQGYQSQIHAEGQQGFALLKEHSFDLILLDLMLPGLSGNEVCRIIRAESQVPIIMVTAKDTEIDKVVEFEDIDCRAAQGLETAGLLD